MNLLTIMFYGLCALAMLGQSWGSLVDIGDRYYTKTVLVNSRSWSTIGVDDFDNVIYRSGYGDSRLYSLKAGHASPALVTGLPGLAYDVLVHPGGVWVATHSGIYNYHASNNSVTYEMASGNIIYFMKLAADGTLYVTDSNFILYKVSDKALVKVSEIPKAACIAFNAEGDLYYGEYWSTPIYKKKAGFDKPAEVVGGIISGGVHQLEVDRRSNYLYLSSSAGGLYVVRPGYMAATKVEGIGPIFGMGIDRHGNMYMESGGDFMKFLDRDLTIRHASSTADNDKKIERTLSKHNDMQMKQIESAQIENNLVLEKTIAEMNKQLDNKMTSLILALSNVMSSLVDRKYSELNTTLMRAGLVREAKLLDACQSIKVAKESWMSEIENQIQELRNILKSKEPSVTIFRRSKLEDHPQDISD